MFGIYLIVNGIERFAVELFRVNNTYTIFGFQPTQAEINLSSPCISRYHFNHNC